MIEKCAVTIAC